MNAAETRLLFSSLNLRSLRRILSHSAPLNRGRSDHQPDTYGGVNTNTERSIFTLTRVM